MFTKTEALVLPLDYVFLVYYLLEFLTQKNRQQETKPAGELKNVPLLSLKDTHMQDLLACKLK